MEMCSGFTSKAAALAIAGMLALCACDQRTSKSGAPDVNTAQSPAERAGASDKVGHEQSAAGAAATAPECKDLPKTAHEDPCNPKASADAARR